MILFLTATRLPAFEGQIQIAPYFDSNLTEQVRMPERSMGLKLRGDVSTELRIQPFLIYGSMLTQGYIDAFYPGESKLVLNPELGLRVPVAADFTNYTRIRYFHKVFSDEKRRLQWTEISSSLHHPLGGRLSGWLEILRRYSRVSAGNLYRYTANEIDLGSRYAFTDHLFLEERLIYTAISHKDFLAQTLDQSNTLSPLPFHQRDHGPVGSTTLEYQGQIIIGAQGGWAHITSNSMIGVYNQFWFRGYLSAPFSSFIFCHLVFQFSRKHYRYSGSPVPREYLDPEGPARNQLHLRLERLFTEHSLVYGQISILRNETIFLNRYYNKTLMEMGVSRTW